VTTVEIIVRTYNGNGQVLPPVLLQEKFELDSHEEASVLRQELLAWMEDRPIPDLDLKLFPRYKAQQRDFEGELLKTLEKLHGPPSLWTDLSEAERERRLGVHHITFAPTVFDHAKA
jgi:hypothetical protein